MTEESFFKQQRLMQRAILAEIEGYGPGTLLSAYVVKMATFGTDRVYCLVSLFSTSRPSAAGHGERDPPAGTGGFVTYPSYQLVPFTTHGNQTASPDGRSDRAAAILSKIISTLLVMSTRSTGPSEATLNTCSGARESAGCPIPCSAQAASTASPRHLWWC
mmetsp:Transcript_27247/g.78386  ORF Transcript_27247/g.78386 Transcript_27247/m.78386 type:complete len:161 (-) Transcript_27247:1116-1598(-)